MNDQINRSVTEAERLTLGLENTSPDDISIVEINTTDARYDFAEHLLETAFPEDERRDGPQQRLYADTNPLFHSCLILKGGDPIGILNYWDFDGVYYIEHFATSPEIRNSGIGGKVLEIFFDRFSPRVILEAELPDDDLSRRRIRFYQRHGLDVAEGIDYAQPPYRPGGHSLPMKILAHPSLSHEECEALCRTIHREVYGVDSRMS